VNGVALPIFITKNGYGVGACHGKPDVYGWLRGVCHGKPVHHAYLSLKMGISNPIYGVSVEQAGGSPPAVSISRPRSSAENISVIRTKIYYRLK